MLTKTKGIVLRKLNYGESSLIVDLFTEEHGLMSYIMGGVRQAKSKSGSALLQVMAIVEIVAYHSEKTKLHRIREAQSAYIFQNIPGDIRKNAIILFLAELCSKIIRQTERHKALYDMIEATVIALDQAKDQFADTHLLFMIRLAHLLGFGPEERIDDASKVFDLQDGRFSKEIPHHQYYLSDPILVDRYLKAAGEVLTGSVAADRIARNQMLDGLLLYFRLHIDKLPQVFGHEVLREIL